MLTLLGGMVAGVHSRLRAGFEGLKIKIIKVPVVIKVAHSWLGGCVSVNQFITNLY